MNTSEVVEKIHTLDFTMEKLSEVLREIKALPEEVSVTDKKSSYPGGIKALMDKVVSLRVWVYKKRDILEKYANQEISVETLEYLETLMN